MGTTQHDDERATIRELTAQVHALLDRVAVLEGTAVAEARSEPVLSRRGLLGRAGGLAAGAGLAVGGGVLAAAPASAANGGPLVLGQGNTATSATTLTTGAASLSFSDVALGPLTVSSTRTGSVGALVVGDAAGLIGRSRVGGAGSVDAYGVLGSSATFPGAIGSSTSQSGVVGQTQSGPAGVLGLNGSDAVNSTGLTLPPAGAGVAGSAFNGPGVAGVGGRAGQVGVYGASVDSWGVQARSNTSFAVRAVSDSGTAIAATSQTGSALAANSNADSASAVLATLDSTTSTGAAVQAVSYGRGNAVRGQIANGASTAAAVRGDGSGEAPGVLGVANEPTDGIGSLLGAGVIGLGYSGAPGVFAYSDTGSSLQVGTNNGNLSPALVVNAEGGGDAVVGEVYTGAGVAVRAEISAASSTGRAVYAVNRGRGEGVRSELTNTSSTSASVVGVTRGKGTGVWGVATGTTSAAVGVHAQTAGVGPALKVTTTSTTRTTPALELNATGLGVGAQLAGGSAPLRLVPRTTAGAPTSGAHQVGELVVDSAGDLFLCKAAGTPGTWRKVVLA